MGNCVFKGGKVTLGGGAVRGLGGWMVWRAELGDKVVQFRSRCKRKAQCGEGNQNSERICQKGSPFSVTLSVVFLDERLIADVFGGFALVDMNLIVTDGRLHHRKAIANAVAGEAVQLFFCPLPHQKLQTSDEPPA